jgi:hypothetical protein
MILDWCFDGLAVQTLMIRLPIIISQVWFLPAAVWYLVWAKLSSSLTQLPTSGAVGW